MFHGIILDQQFKDPKYPNNLQIFAKKKGTINPWWIFGIEVIDADIEPVITDIQKHMKSGKPYYAHFYNDEVLIVVFKDRIYRCSRDKKSWIEAIKYGMSMGIPGEQMDFQPNRFQDEIHYFKT